jgi:Fe-S cluster assembly ATP-binding protein
VTKLDTTERAKKGMFLAFQYPVSIPGLKISEYLRNLYNIRHEKQVSVSEFRKILKEKLEMLNIERASLQRYLNDGFSGGEMKRLEMLQLMLIEPKVAILDEIDSGVDVDAQKIVAESINHIAKVTKTSFIIVTHYQRLLSFMKPDKVHVVLDGRINQSGNMSLVDELELKGYEHIRQK